MRSLLILIMLLMVGVMPVYGAPKDISTQFTHLLGGMHAQNNLISKIIVKKMSQKPKASPGIFSSMQLAPISLFSLQYIEKDNSTAESKSQKVVFRHIAKTNPNLNYHDIDKFTNQILYCSYKYKVDPLLITALITQESLFEPKAQSPVGAVGLGQIMPETADLIGIDPYNENENIEGAVIYLSSQLKRFSHLESALAAYNAGPQAVIEYDGIPPFEETQEYVKNITYYYKNLKRVLKEEGGS